MNESKWTNPLDRVPAHQLIIMVLVITSTWALTMHAHTLVSLLASATSSIIDTDAVMYFTPYESGDLMVGDTRDIDVNVNTRVGLNAIGALLSFPTDTLEIVGISKQKSFLDLWTEDTVIKEAAGEIHWSGGTTLKKGLQGVGTIMTITVRGRKSGLAKLQVKNVELYASDGKGTPLVADLRSLTLVVMPREELDHVVSNIRAPHVPTPPSADLNGDGLFDIRDLSIESLRLFGVYDVQSDFDMNGSVGFSDLVYLYKKIRGR